MRLFTAVWTHHDRVSHIYVSWKNNSRFPTDAYMRRKCIYMAQGKTNKTMSGETDLYWLGGPSSITDTCV